HATTQSFRQKAKQPVGSPMVPIWCGGRCRRATLDKSATSSRPRLALATFWPKRRRERPRQRRPDAVRSRRRWAAGGFLGGELISSPGGSGGASARRFRQAPFRPRSGLDQPRRNDVAEVADGPLQAAAQLDRRLPAEQFPGVADIGPPLLGIVDRQ